MHIEQNLSEMQHDPIEKEMTTSPDPELKKKVEVMKADNIDFEDILKQLNDISTLDTVSEGLDHEQMSERLTQRAGAIFEAYFGYKMVGDKENRDQVFKEGLDQVVKEHADNNNEAEENNSDEESTDDASMRKLKKEDPMRYRRIQALEIENCPPIYRHNWRKIVNNLIDQQVDNYSIGQYGNGIRGNLAKFFLKMAPEGFIAGPAGLDTNPPQKLQHELRQIKDKFAGEGQIILEESMATDEFQKNTADTTSMWNYIKNAPYVERAEFINTLEQDEKLTKMLVDAMNENMIDVPLIRDINQACNRNTIKDESAIRLSEAQSAITFGWHDNLRQSGENVFSWMIRELKERREAKKEIN